MIITEAEFKKRLRKMSDQKIKKTMEQINIHNSPILLLKEYARRFRSENDKISIISNISSRITKEKHNRIKLLKMINAQTKSLSDYHITQSGLNHLSAKSIDALHQKTKSTTSKLKKAVIQVENTNNIIIRLEKLYKDLQA